LTHDRLLYVIQRPFGRITSMPATGQQQPYGKVAQSGCSMALPMQFGRGVDLFQSRVAWILYVVAPMLTLFPDDLTGFK
jgi:hypothetical protein